MTARDHVVKVDSTPFAVTRYGADWVIVGVDVFRATTVICTAAAMGRRCLVAADVAEATALAASVPRALLAGEQGGYLPPGFDVGNSPAEFVRRDDVERPLVLVTSSGTPLLRLASSAGVVYAACLRNIQAQIRQLCTLDLNVAVIGAGTGGERREEDDLACARIAEGLVTAGYAADPATCEVIDEFGHSPVERCASGRSAEFLRRIGRHDDIDFVLKHIDDIDTVFEICGAEVFQRDDSGTHAL